VHETTVLKPDCINQFQKDVGDAFSVFDIDEVSLGNGFISYKSKIVVDISKLNNTNSWKALPSDRAVGGVFDLCLESAVYLLMPDKPKEKMNFVNTNLTVTVEMDANFQVTTINAERKDATQENLNLKYSDYVKAYQCTNANLVTETAGRVYSQGDDLKICVKSTDPNIVQVGSIKSLALSQAGPDAGQEFSYITNGAAVNDEIAATDCDQSISPARVCHADMQLLGRYFAVDEPGELTAFGSVELTFPTSSSRRLTVNVPIAGDIRGEDLALENSSRRMKEEEPEDGPFDVKVSLSKTSIDGSGSDYYGASLLSGMVAAAGGGAILMF